MAKTKAELEKENKALKAEVAELKEVAEAMEVVGQITPVALLASAMEKTEDRRAKHLIERAIKRLSNG